MLLRAQLFPVFPWVCTLLCCSLVACSGESNDTVLPPTQIASALAGSVWSYESLDLWSDGTKRTQDTDGYYFGEDGRFERYLGFDPYLAGTWKVDAQGDLELLYDGAPANTPTIVDVVQATAQSLTLVLPDRVDATTGQSSVQRTYTPSERCPAYMSRWDSRYSAYFLDILTPETQRAGWMAADFDSEGELHVIASRFNNRTDGYYATTRGARCGLRLFNFDGETAARMVIGSDDMIHVAYVVGTTIRYASRLATAGDDVPWQRVDVASNTFSAPELSLALAKDGSVAIAAAGDDGDYHVFRSRTPTAAAANWEVATIPVVREIGQMLTFGVSAAFDPDSRLHIVATPNGTDIVVLRDDDGSWTEMPIPIPPIPGVGFEGPSAFSIADDGTWLLAAGSIGQVDSKFGTGSAGPLFLGKGDASSFTWQLVGAGGRPVLDIGSDKAIHIASFDHIVGGQHTIVRGDSIERFRGNITLSTFDRTALATGPDGRVAIGNNVAVQVQPPAGELATMRVPLAINITNPSGSSITLPEIGESCDASCRVDAEKGRWLQWDTENGPGVTPRWASNQVCRGRALTGHCWLVADDPNCNSGTCLPAIELTFVHADVSAILDPRTPELPVGSWTPYGPVASNGGLAMVLTLVGTSTPSQVVRWNASTRAFETTAIEGWSRVDGLVAQKDGSVILFGSTDGSTTIAGQTGLGGERVAARLASDNTVSWVSPLDPTATPTTMISLSDGFAVGTMRGFQRFLANGTALPAVDAVGVASFTAARLLDGGSSVDMIGPVTNDPANGVTPVSTWLRYDAAGTLAGQTQVPATVVAAARDSDDSVVMALFLQAGQTWENASVVADAWAWARYDAQGNLMRAGIPQIDSIGLGAPSSWAQQMAANVVVREDGTLVFALRTTSQQMQVVRLTPTTWNADLQLGGSSVGGATRTFESAGMAALADTVYLGGMANGNFEFVGASHFFETPSPTVLEIP